MGLSLRVLIVEDNDDDAELLLRALRQGGFEPVSERVQTAPAMHAALDQEWDVIVSDWGMPHFSAMQALALLQETKRDLPFLIVSGTIGEEAAVAAMRAGAHDFIAKGRLSRLIPAIEREMREAAGRAERRRIEQQLQRAMKMEAMGQLTGGVAHDFNNLLGVIVANGDLLLEELKDKSELCELVNEILNSAMHGAELVHRLLAFARQQPLASQVIDLTTLLPPIIAILQRTLGEGISITANFGDHLWHTSTDPSQVQNALLNLAINARDAMPNGGSLVIETTNAQLDAQYATLNSDVVPGDYVMLSITDTGTGMPPEIIERVIEPFFTTKEVGKGTGLGLSMVYGFVKQSGGHFSIYSEVGLGTTIRLYLPRAKEPGRLDSRISAIENDVSVSEGTLVLLVDDNTPLRRVTVRQLTTLGYRVLDAEDGSAALAIIGSGERPDLLFTDIGLPGGMTGRQLAAEVRRRLPHIKVVLTTGYGDPAQQLDAVAPSEHVVLLKPYTSRELARTLRAALVEPATV